MYFYYVCSPIVCHGAMLVKVGITSNPYIRYSSYKTPNTLPMFEAIYGVNCVKDDIIKFETYISSYFKEWHANNFCAILRVIEKAIKIAFKDVRTFTTYEAIIISDQTNHDELLYYKEYQASRASKAMA